MLKRVGERRRSCRTPAADLNQSSPVLPLNRTALWAFVIQNFNDWLMLCFLIVVQKVSYDTLSKAFMKSLKHGRDSTDAADISCRGVMYERFIMCS